MTVYSFWTASRNFTEVSSLNFSLSTPFFFFLSRGLSEEVTFHEHRTGNESFDPNFKILQKTFGEGHSNPRSVVGWLVTFKELYGVFTFGVKQFCIRQWHTQ